MTKHEYLKAVNEAGWDADSFARILKLTEEYVASLEDYKSELMRHIEARINGDPLGCPPEVGPCEYNDCDKCWLSWIRRQRGPNSEELTALSMLSHKSIVDIAGISVDCSSTGVDCSGKDVANSGITYICSTTICMTLRA